MHGLVELCWLVKVDDIDVAVCCADHEQLVLNVHGVDTLLALDGAIAVDWRRSQYLTVLSHEPVIRSGVPPTEGLGIIWQLRMGASWAATWVVVPELRSSIRAALSAPAPTTLVPSCKRRGKKKLVSAHGT